jgi:hypothetical protein
MFAFQESWSPFDAKIGVALVRRQSVDPAGVGLESL